MGLGAIGAILTKGAAAAKAALATKAAIGTAAVVGGTAATTSSIVKRRGEKASAKAEGRAITDRATAVKASAQAEDERLRRLRLIQTPGAGLSTGEAITGRKTLLGQ
jgi:hypothetical protein